MYLSCYGGFPQRLLVSEALNRWLMDVRRYLLRRIDKVRKAKKLARMYVNSQYKYDICIYGSYATGNIGDLAIGQALRAELKATGYSSEIFSRKISVDRSTVSILGGGGQIHDMSEKKLQTDLGRLDETSMIIGVGVEPILSAELQQWVRETLNKFSLITVRDKRSKRILDRYTDAEVIATSCPAFLHDIPETYPCEEYTGISLQPIETPTNSDSPRKNIRKIIHYGNEVTPEGITAQYHELIQDIASSVENPKLIPFHHFDKELCRDFDGLNPFPYDYDVEQTLRRVAGANQMICTRYHSLVFSILCNKPAIAIAYAPKVAELANRAGIPYYKPHQPVDFEFKKPSNRTEILADSKRNIELIEEELSTILPHTN